MNKTTRLFALAALAGCMAATAQAGTVGDTIVIEQPAKVKIETRDTVQRIVINGAKDDPQFQYVQHISIADSSAVRRTFRNVKDFNKVAIKRHDGKPSRWQSSGHVYVGLNNVLDAPDAYDFKLWPSFELGLNVLADWRPYGKQNVWSIGWGINWRHLAMKNEQHWVKTDGVMGLTPYGADEEERKTSLNTAALQVPVTYTHYFDRRQQWGLTLGAILSWNYYAKGKRSFELNGEEYTIKTTKTGQRPVTVEGVAIAHIPSLPDIYCRYSPMKFFRDGRGPKMSLLSVGFYW